MKVLSVQQPWASLIVAGIKDIENRTWQPKQMPERILIHASKKTSLRMKDRVPVEWVQEIFNEQISGNLPDFPDMPANAIIGYVTVERINKDNSGSVWASGNSGDEMLYFWHLTDAHIFDRPITDVKGSLRLWDYDLDEDNLPPAHKAEPVRIVVENDNVIIPLSHINWNEIHPNGTIAIEIATLANQLCMPDVYHLKPFRTITFTYGGQRRRFTLTPETEEQYEIDVDSEEAIMYPSLYEPDGVPRWVAYFVWGDELM